MPVIILVDSLIPGHFQIRGTAKPGVVLAACRGELNFTKLRNTDALSGCSEIVGLIKEEQLLNGQKQVSEPLKHHAFQVLSEQFTKEELKRTTLVIVFIYLINLLVRYGFSQRCVLHCSMHHGYLSR